MKNLNKFVLTVLLGLLILAGIAGATKEKSDKERITILEKQVDALNEAVANQGKDLAGEHAWAEDVNEGLKLMNERTLDLHQRLQKVESRGPVAKR